MKLPIHLQLVVLQTGEPMIKDKPSKTIGSDGAEKEIPARHWTLGAAIGEALMGDYVVVKDGKIVLDQNGKEQIELLSAKERVERFTLAQRVFTALIPDEPEFTTEQVVLIKRLVNLRFDVAIGGQSIALIEQAGG